MFLARSSRGEPVFLSFPTRGGCPLAWFVARLGQSLCVMCVIQKCSVCLPVAEKFPRLKMIATCAGVLQVGCSPHRPTPFHPLRGQIWRTEGRSGGVVMQRRVGCRLWSQTSEVRTQAPPPMGDVTPDKLLHLSVPRFLHLCNGYSGLIGLFELHEV